MILTGKLKDFTRSFSGECSIIFSLDKSLNNEALNSLKDKILSIDIKEYKEKRSNQQNRLFWKTIGAIAKHTGHDDDEIYITVLERANILCDYLYSNNDMLNKLKGADGIRGVKFMGIMNNQYIYKVYFGSSKMNVKEFNQLIEVAQKLASEVQVPYEEINYL